MSSTLTIIPAAITPHKLPTLTPAATAYLLEAGSHLICHCFSEYACEDAREDGAIVGLSTTHLPTRYAFAYTPNFLYYFAVALTTMTYKLAQANPARPSCLLEELALQCMVDFVDSLLDMAADKGEAIPPELRVGRPFDDFLEAYLEDFDYEWLYSDQTPFVEMATPALTPEQVLHDWLEPYTPDDSGFRGRQNPALRP